MFTQTLTLKGPAPQVAYGVIKRRRRVKVVPKAWKLQVEVVNGAPIRAAIDTDNYASYLPRTPVSVRPMSEHERILDAIWNDDYDDDDYYDYREFEPGDAEEYIEPRLRAKLDGRAPDGVDRRRSRRKPVKSWKWRGKDKYRVVTIDQQQAAEHVQHLSY